MRGQCISCALYLPSPSAAPQRRKPSSSSLSSIGRLTLAQGTLDLTLHGTYTNLATGATAGASTASISEETLALAIDYGSTDQAQVGLGLAFSVSPGAPHVP